MNPVDEYDDVPSITRDELLADAVILDVREDDEFAAGHIEGAVHVPIGSLASKMFYDPGDLVTDAPLVLVCKGGGRATRATAWLNANGFDAVRLDGGTRGWAESGRPMASETGQPPAIL
jgi:rhodanese-related sulfurtransferase